MTRIMRKVNDLKPGESMARLNIQCPGKVIQEIIDDVVERYGGNNDIIFATVEVLIDIDARIEEPADGPREQENSDDV